MYKTIAIGKIVMQNYFKIKSHIQAYKISFNNYVNI